MTNTAIFKEDYGFLDRSNLICFAWAKSGRDDRHGFLDVPLGQLRIPKNPGIELPFAVPCEQAQADKIGVKLIRQLFRRATAEVTYPQQ